VRKEISMSHIHQHRIEDITPRKGLSAPLREEIETLAVAYSAMHERREAGQPESEALWAGVLRRAQKRLGVELHNDRLLESIESRNKREE
jgi:hypothetical protein